MPSRRPPSQRDPAYALHRLPGTVAQAAPGLKVKNAAPVKAVTPNRTATPSPSAGGAGHDSASSDLACTAGSAADHNYDNSSTTWHGTPSIGGNNLVGTFTVDAATGDITVNKDGLYAVTISTGAIATAGGSWGSTAILRAIGYQPGDGPNPIVSYRPAGSIYTGGTSTVVTYLSAADVLYHQADIVLNSGATGGTYGQWESYLFVVRIA